LMTHDVDTRLDYDYGLAKFVEIEKQMSFVSTFKRDGKPSSLLSSPSRWGMASYHTVDS
jgi:hypothetical protein